MKKRLSLLLVMVMALTMVIGTGVCAWADSYNNSGCGGGAETEYATHFYSYGVKYSEDENVYVRGLFYYTYQQMLPTEGTLPVTKFDSSMCDEGWYYFYTVSNLKACPAENHGAHPVNPYTASGTSHSSQSAHVHNFVHGIITEPTVNSDGLEGEMCACGAVRNTQPISAFGYTLETYASNMINAAKPGQTITFEFGELNSFPKSFMEKLVAKSTQGVTFVFKYKVNHELQTITIPAGTPIDLNFEWYGYAKMAELYGAY